MCHWATPRRAILGVGCGGGACCPAGPGRPANDGLCGPGLPGAGLHRRTRLPRPSDSASPRKPGGRSSRRSSGSGRTPGPTGTVLIVNGTPVLARDHTVAEQSKNDRHSPRSTKSSTMPTPDWSSRPAAARSTSCGRCHTPPPFQSRSRRQCGRRTLSLTAFYSSQGCKALRPHQRPGRRARRGCAGDSGTIRNRSRYGSAGIPERQRDRIGTPVQSVSPPGPVGSGAMSPMPRGIGRAARRGYLTASQPHSPAPTPEKACEPHRSHRRRDGPDPAQAPAPAPGSSLEPCTFLAADKPDTPVRSGTHSGTTTSAFRNASWGSRLFRNSGTVRTGTPATSGPCRRHHRPGTPPPPC